jgi:hypothetical protein
VIPVEYLHNGFLQEGNYTDSAYLTELSKAQIDFYLNRAKNTLLEYWTNLAENNDFVRQQLRQVVIRDVELKGSVKGDKYICTYPEDILKPLKVYAIAKKGKCKERRLIVRRFPSQKIERALKNPKLSRFWDFEETIATEQSDGYAIYHGGLTITKAVMDYVRKVPDVCGVHLENYESYIKFSGGKPETQNFLIDSTYLADKVIALAVLYAKRDYRELQDYQTQLQVILQIDRIF